MLLGDQGFWFRVLLFRVWLSAPYGRFGSAEGVQGGGFWYLLACLVVRPLGSGRVTNSACLRTKGFVDPRFPASRGVESLSSSRA